jgi:lipoprotein-anchoring transpeptidase ErfK/SrfK
MRRLIGIPVRSAVVVALPLVGAIYLAGEARQAVIRHYSPVTSLQPINAQPSAIGSTRSGDPAPGGSSDRPSPPTPGGQGIPGGDRTVAPASALAAPSAQAPPNSKSPAQDELSAEQLASQLPAQKPPKKTAQDAHTRQIIISIPDRRLALLEDGQLVKAYAVAVGASETPSPDGEFTIINHAVDPTYRHADKEIGPGKDNPLGTRWMGLSLKGYGIHGTNVQSSVGKAASHGCFRMKKKDVEELYSRVQVGDAVSIRGYRDELTASLFTTGTNPSPAAAASKVETQIASVTTPSATGDEDR